MIRGEVVCRLFELDQNSTILGRDPDCKIVLGCKGVSPKHARIYRRRDGYFLEDLGSADGTQINGQTSSGPVRLRCCCSEMPGTYSITKYGVGFSSTA